MKILAILAAVLMTGCSLTQNREPIMTLHSDEAFTDHERQCIGESVGVWRSQTNGYADINVVYDYRPNEPANWWKHRFDDRLVRWQSSDKTVREYEAKMAELTGEKFYLYGQAAGDIVAPSRPWVEVRLVTDRFKNNHECVLTVVHELGHALGLDHTDNPTYIMFPSVHQKRTACLKKNDLEQFTELHGYKMEDMSPCPDQDPGVFK